MCFNVLLSVIPIMTLSGHTQGQVTKSQKNVEASKHITLSELFFTYLTF